MNTSTRVHAGIGAVHKALATHGARPRYDRHGLAFDCPVCGGAGRVGLTPTRSSPPIQRPKTTGALTIVCRSGCATESLLGAIGLGRIYIADGEALDLQVVLDIPKATA